MSGFRLNVFLFNFSFSLRPRGVVIVFCFSREGPYLLAYLKLIVLETLDSHLPHVEEVIF